MGGSSKKVTVGYKYYLGMHLVACQGPIDRVNEIRVGERVVYAAPITASETIAILAPNIFGGESREGGVSGFVDVMFGDPGQLQNTYLQQQIQTDIPAYRGVVSLVLNQTYLGTNPYLKNWDLTVERINVRQDGVSQWYQEKATIGGLDLTRHDNLKVATTNLLKMIKDYKLGGLITDINIGIKGFNLAGYEQRLSASIADIDDLITWVEALTTPSLGGGTSYFTGVQESADFFNGNGTDNGQIGMLITDGIPTHPTDPQIDVDAALARLALISDPYKFYSVNIEAYDTQYSDQISNVGGAIVVKGYQTDYMMTLFRQWFEAQGGTTAELYLALDCSGSMDSFPSQAQRDMNPAHIIRECLTDPDWGMGYPESDVDDTSFTTAADQLYAEGMGISLIWDRQISVEEFINVILNHIDATVYVDRTTGKFKLKLIRDDYIEASLPIINETNIKKLNSYVRNDPLQSANTVTVKYYNWETTETDSVTADDIALVQERGTVDPITLEFDGFTYKDLAQRVALRELRAASLPLVTADITCDRNAASLNIGDAFKFFWADNHDGYLIMRVTEMKEGGSGDNTIRIKCIQDVFSLPDAGIIGSETPGWTNPQQPPTVPATRIIEESSYYDLARNVGDAEAQELLAIEPDAGYVAATSVSVPAGINGIMQTDSGAGYNEVGVYDFVPVGTLTADVGFFDTTFTISTNVNTYEDIEVNTYAKIGNEYVSIEAIDSGANTLTVKRGILDTIPEPHLTGDTIYFIEDFLADDSTQYLFGETIGVKLSPVTGYGTLSLLNTPEDQITMNSRAIRPYPPADVKFNGEYFPTAQVPLNGDVVLTWNSRNRIQQTSGSFVGWTEASISPEPNTTYTINFYNDSNDELLESVTGITDLTYTMLYADYPTVSNVRMEILTERDGYESLASLTHTMNIYRELLVVTQATVMSFVKPPVGVQTTSMTNMSFVKGSTLTASNMGMFSFVKGSGLTAAQATVITFVKAP